MNTQSFLSMFVFFVFITLAVIHLYWFARGKWALNVAFPTKESGEKLMKFDNSLQTKLPTLAVAVNYLGLFKKVKSTPFAQKDSSLYVPLCLFLSITLIALCL